MEYIYDVQTRGCLVWETERPLTDISRKSSNFWLLGYEWNFHLTVSRSKNNTTDTYKITLRKVADSLPLETVLNVTTYIPDEVYDCYYARDIYNYAFMTHKGSDAEQVVWSVAKKPASEHPTSWLYKKWTVVFTFHSDQPLRLRLPRNETELASSQSDTDPELNPAPDAKNLSKAILSEDKCVQTCSDVPPDLERLSSDFRQLLKRDIFPDVALRCGNRTINAHRSILAARSDVFINMFQKKSGNVDVRDVDSEVLDLLLQYVYSGKIPDLSDDTASRLYKAGDKYSIHSLKKACSDWMVRNLTAENCLDYLLVANRYCDEEFKERVVDFVVENMESIRKDAWTKLTDYEPHLAIRVYERRFPSALAKQT